MDREPRRALRNVQPRVSAGVCAAAALSLNEVASSAQSVDMARNFSNRACYLANVIASAEQHRMMEDDAASMCAFHFRQIARAAESAPRPADVQGTKSLVHRNSLGPDRDEKPFSR